MSDSDYSYTTSDPNCASAGTIAQCDQITINNFIIQSPEILPCCLASLIVGLYTGIKTLKRSSNSHIMYGIAFIMIGFMMTDAGINDCILSKLPWTKWHIFSMVFDVAFTSSIGIAFGFAALVDAKVIKEGFCTVAAFLAIVGAIFAAWYDTIVNKKDNFQLLYFGCVGLGCGVWVVVQVVLMVKRKSLAGVGWMLAAAVSGGAGFIAARGGKLDLLLCEMFSCHFAGTFLWFLVTPIACYLIYRYTLVINPEEVNMNDKYSLMSTSAYSQPQYQRGNYASIDYLEMGRH